MSVYTPEQAERVLTILLESPYPIGERGERAKSFLQAVIYRMQHTDAVRMFAAMWLARLAMEDRNWVDWLSLSRVCSVAEQRAESVRESHQRLAFLIPGSERSMEIENEIVAEIKSWIASVRPRRAA